MMTALNISYALHFMALVAVRTQTDLFTLILVFRV
jgi:hypothetical protein